MNEPKQLYILKLLHILKRNLDIDELIGLGLEYYQIAQILAYCIEKDFVKDSESGLELTDVGEEQLEKLNQKVYPSNSKTWILPSEENRIPKIDKFDIYLPKRKSVEE